MFFKPFPLPMPPFFQARGDDHGFWHNGTPIEERICLAADTADGLFMENLRLTQIINEQH